MLENIKMGDLVIFKNGQEAFVTKVNHSDEGYYNLCFSEKICCFLEDGSRSSSWYYDKTGRWSRNSNFTLLEKYNDIAKVVSC